MCSIYTVYIDGEIRVQYIFNARHFNPINELYSGHHSLQPNLTHTVGMRGAAISLEGQQSGQATSISAHMQQQQGAGGAAVGAVAMAARMNGSGGSNPYDSPARKKPRRSTNDSQHSQQSQASLSLPPPTGSVSSTGSSVNANSGSHDAYNSSNNGLLVTAAPLPSSENNHRLQGAGGGSTTPGNKENANPVDFVLRRPRNCALLNTYKPTHKLANNHFHRYTDVKPREERRASVIDLANQPNVQGKINGWKIHHLRSQMEDLSESEMVSQNKLESMLEVMEKDKDSSADIERIKELLKGNIQRSKIITDGINDAQNQMLKIFEHKPHVLDIICRCASKRNFKKRDKV